MALMITIPPFLEEPSAQDTVAFLYAEVSLAVANHCLRTYVYAEHLVDLWGRRADPDYDAAAVFYATALHEIGLGPTGGATADRFEVAGADIAARFLVENGVDQSTIDRVWPAIALNTSAGIAHRFGLLTHLVSAAGPLDFGVDSESVTDEMADELHSRFPRLGAASAIYSAMTGQAKADRRKAPLASLAHYFVRTEGMGVDPDVVARWGD